MQGSLAEVDIHDQSYRVVIGAAIRARFAEAEIVDPMELHPDGGLNYGPEEARRTLLEMAEEAAQADVLIAYLPEASMGTAIEMWQAHRAGKPITVGLGIIASRCQGVVQVAESSSAEPLGRF